MEDAIGNGLGTAPDLAGVLRRVFGYDAFRPLQREIMTSFLAGRDILAVLPTGAGKSLCFQIPALCGPGLTLVVSPLIALMKDQVDGLATLGIAATCLNSSLAADEARTRLRELHAGRIRLLYVSPERLMLEGFAEQLQAWGVARIAVDEAHCISEWGADFRPEYRRIGELREKLPGVPLLALTATATARVRDDIIRHLKLRDTQTFLASFNRPNLSYRVEQKDNATRQILAFLRGRERECGIVYCFSRKQTETLADHLQRKGIPAAAYHAGLDPAQRSATQDDFLRDRIRVICATVAFGMGINKPNVRFVIHHDLPRNLEGYYQETGRAGRDGLPADCLLLYSGGDAAKQRHFIDEIEDPAEQQRARQMLGQMLSFAEGTRCRRVAILAYFGESFQAADCQGCDICLAPLESYDATVPAQKLLSCVYRIGRASGRSFGVQHVVDVLLGSSSERIVERGHDKLSTHGIGRDLPRSEWVAIARQLIARGLLEVPPGDLPTVALAQAGLELLRSRAPILLHRSRVAAPAGQARDRGQRKRAAGVPHDEILFERLRVARRAIADERNVPAYMIAGDVALIDIARNYPLNRSALSRIGGLGEVRLRQFGDKLVQCVKDHLQEHPRLDFGLPEPEAQDDEPEDTLGFEDDPDPTDRDDPAPPSVRFFRKRS